MLGAIILNTYASRRSLEKALVSPGSPWKPLEAPGSPWNGDFGVESTLCRHSWQVYASNSSGQAYKLVRWKRPDEWICKDGNFGNATVGRF